MNRARLGAEELIELGQASPVSTAGNVPPPTARQVSISRQEADLIVRIVEAIIKFAQDFPLEFSSYCPVERWQPVLDRVGTGVQQIQSQLKDNTAFIQVPADLIFATMDLEECVTGARDARLSSAKTALIISALAAGAQLILGVGWLSLPAYIISLAVVLGRPLATRFKSNPAEPFRVGGPKPPFPRKQNSVGNRLIERVIVSRGPEQHHHWGSVAPSGSHVHGTVALARGDFRVRIEGFDQDRVTVAAGWHRVPVGDAVMGRREIAVWGPGDLPARATPWGGLSGHLSGYWVDYTGLRTQGVLRRAGPFDTKVDAMSHAIEDADIVTPGLDGGLVIYDPSGQVEKVIA